MDDVVSTQYLRGVGKGFIECHDKGVVNYYYIFNCVVKHSLTHDLLIEALIAIEKGVHQQMAIKEMPGKKLAVVLVGQLYHKGTGGDFLTMYGTNVELVLVVDGLKVDIHGVAIEHVADDVRIVDDLIEMVYEVIAIALFEGFELANFIVG